MRSNLWEYWKKPLKDFPRDKLALKLEKILNNDFERA